LTLNQQYDILYIDKEDTHLKQYTGGDNNMTLTDTAEVTQDAGEGLALQMYMQIGSYEATINKYANPIHPVNYPKYNKLKKKILQWQNNIPQTY
jgi:hypothetical protein